eukprot:Awhi_evm2s1800
MVTPSVVATSTVNITQSNQILINNVVPLTGYLTQHGVSITRALQAYFSLHGKDYLPNKNITIRDQDDESSVISAALKATSAILLMEKSPAAFVGAFGSSSSISVGGFLSALSQVQLSCTSTNPDLSNK